MNVEALLKGREQDAVVADAEPEAACKLALQGFHVAMAGLDVAEQSIEDEQGGGPVEGADIGGAASSALQSQQCSFRQLKKKPSSLLLLSC